MGAVNYRQGIAILQLIIFPCILVAALFIWKRTGWRAGGKIWRFAVTLSLIRIAGSISSLISIDHDSYQVEVAVVVCEMIGLAPLLLTYIGLLRQIDIEQRMPPRFLNGVTILAIIGLILGITGVNTGSHDEGYHPDSIVKASMGIFIAVFVIILLLTVNLFLQLRSSLRVFQSRLFLAIALSTPFLLIRVIYSAMADYSDDKKFSAIGGDTTTFLCMNVLEEIAAMAITMVLGVAAVRADDFTHVNLAEGNPGPKVEQV